MQKKKGKQPLHEKQLVKNSKIELDCRNKAERAETKNRRRITKENFHVPAETPPPSTHEKVDVEKEETQTSMPPSRRKVLAKKSKAPMFTNTAHYPLS